MLIQRQAGNWTNRRPVLFFLQVMVLPCVYSLLHLFWLRRDNGRLEELRQLGSKTPGHPEVNHTDGIEATSGPLGQGIANAVGMAMAEAHLAAKFNKPGFDIVDHYTYALHGDGCLMEGVSQEAASLAGHLKLGKLVLLYDSMISHLMDQLQWLSQKMLRLKFEAYGWQHILVKDGNDWKLLLKLSKKLKLRQINHLLSKLRHHWLRS